MAKKKTRCDREDPDPGRAGNARAAGRHRARPARDQHHGLLQGVQRGDREPARPGDPGRDLDLRGPLVHVRHQDAAHAVPAAAGRGHREGRGEPAHREGGKVTRVRCARSPRRRCPTSTPSTSKARCSRSRARRARWESRSATSSRRPCRRSDLAAGRRRSCRRGSAVKRKAQHDQARQEVHRRDDEVSTASVSTRPPRHSTS